MYGTTEAFRSTYLIVGQSVDKNNSVGRPFPGVAVTVEDEHGTACNAGQVGEIVHRGAFISPGYWNDGGSGNEVFVDDSVRTGDYGRLDENGYLYFEGRKDSLIKTQGYRVSPEEIEKCLYEIEGVKEAAVYRRRRKGGGITDQSGHRLPGRGRSLRSGSDPALPRSAARLHGAGCYRVPRCLTEDGE